MRRDELIKQAETDPEAAARLADKRARSLATTNRCNAGLAERALTDPEAATKLMARRSYSRQYCRAYREKKKELNLDKPD